MRWLSCILSLVHALHRLPRNAWNGSARCSYFCFYAKPIKTEPMKRRMINSNDHESWQTNEWMNEWTPWGCQAMLVVCAYCRVCFSTWKWFSTCAWCAFLWTSFFVCLVRPECFLLFPSYLFHYTVSVSFSLRLFLQISIFLWIPRSLQSNEWKKKKKGKPQRKRKSKKPETTRLVVCFVCFFFENSFLLFFLWSDLLVWCMEFLLGRT